MDFLHEIKLLRSLVDLLKKTKNLGEKEEILRNHTRIQRALTEGDLEFFLPSSGDLENKIVLFSLCAIGQEKIVLAYPEKRPSKGQLRELFSQLVAIDRFYESIGGIIGYQLKVLELLVEERGPLPKIKKVSPFNFVEDTKERTTAIFEGIQALPETGEVYPLGGLGSRLNLKSKAGDPLPVAVLPFCGRSLLEGLIRDVQAREFLYVRLFEKLITIPIAIMTSLEKKNDLRIRSLCKRKRWFGRRQESFFIFAQLSVPVVTADGYWSMQAPLVLNLQPGGHGALWHTAKEKGAFRWFQKQSIHQLIIRQINNIVSGVDYGLLGLIGVGRKRSATFGFTSCPRFPKAAEGVLGIVEEKGGRFISNIEYTDFKLHGIDEPSEKEASTYPANVNILFVDLQKILPVLEQTPFPGLMLNMKETVPFISPDGKKDEVKGGRLESMMQNISDSLKVSEDEPLTTFLTYNDRKKTISAIKRGFEKGKELLETPEGAFYDLLLNGYELLTTHCHVALPLFSTPKSYLEKGPTTIFLYHPALGPLYEIIAKKIQGGRFVEQSELQLEIADLLLINLHLRGSLLVEAKNLLGDSHESTIHYSQKTGKCILKNVVIENEGIERELTTTYWRNKPKRHQAFKIVLEGHSEFYAENVTWKGEHTIIVPDGVRLIAEMKGEEVIFRKEKAGWVWRYVFESVGSSWAITLS